MMDPEQDRELFKHTTFKTEGEVCQFKLTTPTDGTPPKLVGYAVVFNQLSTDRGGYFVRILPGSIDFPPDRPVQALYQHDGGMVLGSTRNNTLTMKQDDYGLRVEITPPVGVTYADDVVKLVQQGYIDGMSFGTTPTKVKNVTEGGKKVVEYVRQTVDEVTITGQGAFSDASISAQIAPKPVQKTYSRADYDHNRMRFLNPSP